MKVRFTGEKELAPDRDNGLKVLYGPGKRVAYRLRWYLILLLVASPLVLIFTRLLLGELHQEVPAQLSVPTQDLRAGVNGVVATLPVTAGEKVKAGQLLVQLNNPDWRLRLLQLAPASLQRQDNLGRSAQAIARNTVQLQDQMVDLYKGLQREGGLSSAELLQSEVQLNSTKLSLLELQRRLRLETYQVEDDPIQNLRDEREREWLQGQLKRLSLRAEGKGRVAEVLVDPGDNVGPGTLLMRIERDEEPLLWVYLQPREARSATPGQPVKVQMPDGSWLGATVVDQPDLARRLPPGLRPPGEDDRLALVVPMQFDQPLPTLWRVNQLPLKVRFPFRWQNLWPG